MKTMTRIFLFTLMIGTLYAARVPPRQQFPAGAECSSHQDCPPGYCCTIGMERYSYPVCRRQPGLNDQCRPGEDHREKNTSRYYPDGVEIFLEDVYRMICPCSIGLECDRHGGVCRDANSIPTGDSNERY